VKLQRDRDLDVVKSRFVQGRHVAQIVQVCWTGRRLAINPDYTHHALVWTRLVRFTSLDCALGTGATSDSTRNQLRYHQHITY
jgi:hypothetical protein